MDHVTAETENSFVIQISEKNIMYDDACKLCKYYDAVYKICFNKNKNVKIIQNYKKINYI